MSFTLQYEVDSAQLMGDLEPILTVAGSAAGPAFRAANDTMNAICATAFPWKWNEITLPAFYTNSYQQDYALVNPDGSSVLNLAWLERGVAFDINNTSQPKPWINVECGRELPQRTGTYFNSGTTTNQFLCNYFPNKSLYYGVWGRGNVGSPTLGNDPGPGSVIQNPLGASVLFASWMATAGGQVTFGLNYLPNSLKVGTNIIITQAFPIAYNNSYLIVSISGTNVTATSTSNPGTYESGGVVSNSFNPAFPNNPPNLSQPANPIGQIRDANGNLLVITTYGTEGTTAPVAPKGATPGTTCSGSGATTVWTVVDPNGAGIRILDIPSQTGSVFQFILVGQAKPIRFTSLQQTLDPLPDDMESHFFQGFIAQLSRYSDETKIREKFKTEWPLWLQSLSKMREKEDRELEENSFTPDRGIMGSGRARNTYVGAANPFNYPRQ